MCQFLTLRLGLLNPIKPRPSRLVVAILLIGAIACREEIPLLVSGEVSFRSLDGTEHERMLTQEQLQLLTAWLEVHRSGWGMRLTPDPIPSAFCRVKHSDGQTSVLALYSIQGWTESVKLCGLGHTHCAHAIVF